MIEQVSITIPWALYRRARELARKRNQPVADVLIDALDQVLPVNVESAVANEDMDMQREMEAYIALHPALKKKRLGQHVAIYRGKLIDVDDDYGALYARIDAQYPDEFVWLATITEEAMPTLVFRSPRLMSTE